MKASDLLLCLMENDTKDYTWNRLVDKMDLYEELTPLDLQLIWFYYFNR